MPNDRNGGFRVAVTRDVRRSDGTFTFAPYNLEPLERAGIPWRFLDDDTLTPEALADVDGLYHYATPLPTTTLDGVERLAVIARHGVGLDYLDVAACTERGIAVTITPDGVTRPMASAAVTLVLALAHRLSDRDRALHEGDWGAGRFLPRGTGLSGRTLGVIGYGRIGRDVVRLLEPWGMRVLVTQRTPVTEAEVTYVPLDELLARGRRRRRRLPADRRDAWPARPPPAGADEADRVPRQRRARRDRRPGRARRRPARGAPGAAPGSTSSIPSHCRSTTRCSRLPTSSARRTRSATRTSCCAGASSRPAGR